MPDATTDARAVTIQEQPEATAAELRAAVDALTVALNRRTAQLRLLIRAAGPVLDSLVALVHNDHDGSEFYDTAARECIELRDVLKVAELVR